MKQIIEIEVPEGKKAVLKDGKVVFEDITPQLPKTWKEFCEIYNKTTGEFWINNDSVIAKQTEICVERSIHRDKNLLPSEQAAKQHLALMQLHQLRDCYREKCNSDSNEDSYSIAKHEGKPFVYRNKFKDCFLTFTSESAAKEFLNNFKDLIEQAGDLI